MINFELTDEQKALKDLARKFAMNEIRPIAAKCDQESAMPMEVFNKAWQNGLMNEFITPEFGGIGLNSLDTCILIEEMAYGCPGIATSLFCNNLALAPIEVAGTSEQKQKFFGQFMNEFQLASFCLSEPGAGSDVAGLSTKVTKEGDDYILNGSKQWITNAGQATLFTVFATLDKSLGHKGMCAFVVDAKSEGISLGKKEDKMGQRASDTRAVIFENVRVPKENLLGEEGKGFKVAMQALDRTRPAIAAMAVGASQAAMDHSVKYAKERVAFGKPIASNQGISFLLADMAKDIAASRLLAWHAAWKIDQGLPASKESSFAKCFATDAAMRITTDAVQVHGGYGYTKEYPVEKLMRDVKVMQIFEGANQIQRLVIAKELLSE
jgi:acyl-CoA dehydrogenase